MATNADIVSRASTLLNDTDPDVRRWSDTELLGWVKESMQAIIALQPTANTVRRDVTLNGVEHQIPTDTWSLVKPVCSLFGGNPGGAVKTWREDQLDSVQPNWRFTTPSTIVSAVVFDPADRRTYYSYPPATGAVVRLVFSVVPSVGALTDTFPLAAPYEPVSVDYVCYRALMKDAEAAGMLAIAQAYYGSFVQALGAGQNARLEINPNLDSGPMVPTAIGAAR